MLHFGQFFNWNIFMGHYVNELDLRLQLTDKERYRREQYQSFMTGPEWRNVEMAEEFATMLRDNKSMFSFPYFRQILDLWKVVYRSYSSARKYNSIREILFSEYLLMDLFIAAFTTMEFIPKGVLSLLLYPFLKKENDSPMQAHLANYFTQYAKDLQTIPFYDHMYGGVQTDLSDKYHQQDHHTWVDWFTWKALSFELWAKKWVSKPLKYWFHQEGNEAPPTTDILVKFDAIDIEDGEQAKNLFRERLDQVQAQQHQVSLVDEHLYAKDHPKTKNDHTYTSVYARLKSPRYASFQPALYALEAQGIHLRKISGQDRVQVKCTIDTHDEDNLLAKEEVLNKIKKAEPLYTYINRIHPNRKICLFDVPVRNLHKTLKRFEKQEDVAVSFIHNF